MKWFLSRLLVAETIVAGAFYAIAAAILFADVVSRELFNDSIWGGQRMAVLFANASALIGISVAVALNRHIRPSVFDTVFPESWSPYVVRLGHVISACVLLGGAYFAVLLVLDNRSMGFTTPPLDLEIWIPQLALPYGLGMAGLKFLIFAGFPDLQPNPNEGA